MEFPLQKLMELNIKTMQGFSYMKPGELFSIKKPEELLERNMNMLIRNSHMAIDYMRDTFSILENHWIKVSHRTEESAKDIMEQASSAVKKASSTAKKVSSSAKKASSTIANKISSTATSTAKKSASAKPAAKKTAAHTKSAAKPSTKTVAKAGEKKSAKKSSKPVVQHSKSTMPHSQDVMKQETRTADEKAKHHPAENKEQGHSASKVSPMHDKGVGLVNKGRNFPN